MTDREINQKIKNMIEDENTDITTIIQYVKGKCSNVNLTPQTLGMLFEAYANVVYNPDDVLSGYSREITISELKNIHPGFESTNGCQWARSDNSYLGKRYIISRPKKGGKVYSVKLDGLNIDSVKRNRGIRDDIRKKLSKESCAILDTHSQIEIDHKNGRYNSLSNIDLNTQRENDFQALSKAANDAKRRHCAECIRTGKRYNAKRLGYKEGFIVGDENSPTCPGCYWYDPKRFNEVISKDFKKTM